MGRTKRIRERKKQSINICTLDDEAETVNLKRWLHENGFSDPLKLELRRFPTTGRGITSAISIKGNDALIRVPISLLITYNTLRESGLLENLSDKNVFNIHTLIAYFLALEKHKQEKSSWVSYIRSLPDPEPVLPWTEPDEVLTYFPRELQEAARKLQRDYQDNFVKLTESIMPTAFCPCCKTRVVCVLDERLFKWAYVLVNTRAVYIDPCYVFSMTKTTPPMLSDEPSMALCPFLDMFNHHYLAETVADVVSIQGRQFYELRTLKKYKKKEQFFICYGAHDNVKLLMEYGFFIPGNPNDCVYFTLNELIRTLDLSFNERQYKYIKKHSFDTRDIYINSLGPSYNLKAICFIHSYTMCLNYSSVIFGEAYSDEFSTVMTGFTKKLLDYKLKGFKESVENINSRLAESDKQLRLLKDFLEFRVTFIEKLIYDYEKW